MEIVSEIGESKESRCACGAQPPRIDQTLDVNSDNIDELLDNMRHVTENLKEFSSTIKTRPYTLIRASNPRQHRPGEPTMRCKIIFTALALCLGVLNGCGATRPSKYYQLTVPSDKTSSAEPAPYPVTLLLGPIVTSNLYRDDRLVYTSGGEAMGTYEFQRWAEPPAEMIKDVLLRELQASTRYQYVYSSRSDVRGDYLLRGHLYDFREIDGNVLTARVAFYFELHDNKTGSTVWSRYYSHDEPIDGKDVSAVVAALNRNVMSGLSEVRAGLDQYFATHTAEASTAAH